MSILVNITKSNAREFYYSAIGLGLAAITIMITEKVSGHTYVSPLFIIALFVGCIGFIITGKVAVMENDNRTLG